MSTPLDLRAASRPRECPGIDARLDGGLDGKADSGLQRLSGRIRWWRRHGVSRTVSHNSRSHASRVGRYRVLGRQKTNQFVDQNSGILDRPSSACPSSGLSAESSVILLFVGK